MGYFSSTDRAGRGAASSAFTYLLSIAFVAAALAITLGIREFSAVYPTFFAFYAAVAVSAWYGGYGPGWLSVVLSTLTVNYFFLPPLYSLTPSSADLPHDTQTTRLNPQQHVKTVELLPAHRQHRHGAPPGTPEPRECHLYFAEGCHLYMALTGASRIIAYYDKLSEVKNKSKSRVFRTPQ